jgi:hypothetical protein
MPKRRKVLTAQDSAATCPGWLRYLIVPAEMLLVAAMALRCPRDNLTPLPRQGQASPESVGKSGVLPNHPAALSSCPGMASFTSLTTNTRSHSFTIIWKPIPMGMFSSGRGEPENLLGHLLTAGHCQARSLIGPVYARQRSWRSVHLAGRPLLR